jgi:hypothetical protein
MSAFFTMSSSLDDIIKIKKFIKIDKDNVEEITEKNSEKIFQKRNIYIDYNKKAQIGIGHIVYTKTKITASQNNEINEALKKTFINYVYLNNSNNNIQPKLINIEESIDGDIDDNLYFEFKKEYNKQINEKKNEIELSFTFKTSKSVTLKFYDYFFENNNTNYYITSGKCGSGNNKYYENADDGNLFNAFQQIFNPNDMGFIDFMVGNKFEELQDIVKNVYIDSKAHPDIKKYYDIASEFTIENKKVNIDGFIDFINKNNNWCTIDDLKILSKYFNLNCNVIEFEENKLINKLNDIDREIEILQKERENEILQKERENEREKLVNELERLESNTYSIPIKNIHLNDSEGSKLYPFINENQIYPYPYTFCNLDGKKWYLKKHNCEIDYDSIKDDAKQRYDDLKSKNTLETKKLPPPPNAGNMNIQKINIKEFFTKNSFFIESEGNKYLFASVDDTDKSVDDTDSVNFKNLSELKNNIIIKEKPEESREESRSIKSYRSDISITNIEKPFYKIIYEGQTYYVIPL